MKSLYRDKICLAFIYFIFLAGNAGAQTTGAEEAPISYALSHNEFFEESLKQRSLARLTMQEGDYDKSAWHSSEAERFARLSDEYIARRLLLARVNKEIFAAEERLAWAKRNEAETYFPTQLKNGEAHYDIARSLRAGNELHGALENALAALKDLSVIAAPPKKDKNGNMILPANLPKQPNKYTVRPWDLFGDCFWNIAKRFYGDAYKWPVLYEANKDKIPDINNPDLIEVGTVIDIPDLSGEARIGMYDTGRPFQPSLKLP